MIASRNLGETIAGPDRALALGLMFAILFLAGLIPWYYLSFYRRSSQTLGQKLFGLYVVGPEGRPRDFRAALVRFVYFTLSLLFILPLGGYLFILFTKAKQGLHDRLAQTYVVTPKSAVKTIGAVIVSALLLAGTGWQAVNLYQSLPESFFGSKTKRIKKADLDNTWLFKTDQALFFHNLMIFNNRCLIAAENRVHCLDIPTGKVLWEKDNLTFAYFPDPTAGEESEILLITYFGEDKKQILLRAEPETGRIIWETAMETDEVLIYHNREILIAMDDNYLRAYDLDHGNVLWTVPSDSGLENENEIILGENIVYLKQGKEDISIEYMDKTDGSVKARINHLPYNTMVFPLPGSDQYLVYGPNRFFFS